MKKVLFLILLLIPTNLGAQDTAHWSIKPDFANLGLSVVSCPGPQVGNEAQVVIDLKQDLSLSYAFDNPQTHFYYLNAISVVTLNHQWTFKMIFPETGVYRLRIFVKTPEGKDYTEVASIPLEARVSRTADEEFAMAVKTGDLEKIVKALDRGANPNMNLEGYVNYSQNGKVFSFGAPAFFFALKWVEKERDQIAALKTMKSHGADFKAVTDQGRTLVSEVISGAYARNQESRKKLLQTVLELGADPNQLVRVPYYLDNKLTTREEPVVSAVLGFGDTAVGNLIDTLPLLLQAGLKPNASSSTGEKNLGNLFTRYKTGFDRLIRILLDAGLDPDPDSLGQMLSWLKYSKEEPDWTLVDQVLSKSTHINELNGQGDALVHQLGFVSPPERRNKLFALLGAKHANFDIFDSNGLTPLMRATFSFYKPYDTDLIERYIAAGADPQIKNNAGRNALFYLHVNGDSDLTILNKIADRLLSLGVDINTQDRLGRTVLYNACTQEMNLGYLQFLISKGANPSLADIDGVTPHAAARMNDAKKAAAYLSSLKVPEFIGGWPTGNGSLAAKAVLSGDEAQLKGLSPADLESLTARSSAGVPATALHLAVESGNLTMVNALTALKVNWNVKDRYGDSPLAYAVRDEKAGVVKALVDAQANPGQKNLYGVSCYDLAVTQRSPLLKELLRSKIAPGGNSLAFSLIVTAPLDQIKALSEQINWTQDELDACITFGRPDVLKYLEGRVPHPEKSTEAMVNDSQKAEAVYRQWEESTKTTFQVSREKSAWSDKPGSYLFPLPTWSPWFPPDPKLDLKKYPVAVYVPKGYDGTKPYGLVISMMNAKSSSQFPKPEYLKTLDEHHLIYVGFDPYNGIFEDSGDLVSSHDPLCLAAAYQMMKSYSIDRSRVYLMGFSWGGRLTGELVPRYPRVFTGGLAVCGCFITKYRFIPSFRYAQNHTTMVLTTGDYDYNREETHNGFSFFQNFGFDAHYFQEPKREHARVSGENFEKAMTLLDQGSAKRAELSHDPQSTAP